MKKIVKIIGTLALLGLIIGGGYGYWMWNKPHRDVGAEQADFQLTANELLQEFTNNEESANEQYLEKVVQVEGSVKEASTSEGGRVSLLLETEGADMGGVNARFSEGQTEAAKNIAKGDQLTIKCRCIGFEADLFKEVRLDNCSLVE